MIVCTIDSFFPSFQYALYHLQSIDYMHQLCFLYILKPVYSLSETERERLHMQETMFTLARLKIVPTIKNLYHIQCQRVDELSSLVSISSILSLTAINQARHV